MDLEPELPPERTPMKLPSQNHRVRHRWSRSSPSSLGTIVVTRDNSDAEPAVEPAVTKEVAVERGNISVSETVDGTVEETDTIIVVHRIEGQTPSTAASQTVATPAATPNSRASAAPVGFVSPDSTEPRSARRSPLTPDSAIVAVAFVTAAVHRPGRHRRTTPTDTTPATGVSDTGPRHRPTPHRPTRHRPTRHRPTRPADSDPTDTTPADTTPSRPGGGAPSGGAPLGAPAGGDRRRRHRRLQRAGHRDDHRDRRSRSRRSAPATCSTPLRAGPSSHSTERCRHGAR